MGRLTRFFKRQGNRGSVRELYNLTDRQLEDIGLTRGDLDKLMKDEE